MTPDFEYLDQGLFTAIFANNTKAGKELSRFMVGNDNSNKILTVQFSQFKDDLRRAGYSMRKATAPTETDSDLLESLLS